MELYLMCDPIWTYYSNKDPDIMTNLLFKLHVRKKERERKIKIESSRH